MVYLQVIVIAQAMKEDLPLRIQPMMAMGTTRQKSRTMFRDIDLFTGSAYQCLRNVCTNFSFSMTTFIFQVLQSVSVGTLNS